MEKRENMCKKLLIENAKDEKFKHMIVWSGLFCIFCYFVQWWYSEIIPRFPKIFEYAHFPYTKFQYMSTSGAKKSHKTFRNLRLGHLAFDFYRKLSVSS